MPIKVQILEEGDVECDAVDKLSSIVKKFDAETLLKLVRMAEAMAKGECE